MEHCIVLQKDQIPISIPPHRMSPQKMKILRLNKMIQNGIIEECESPWVAPVVLVSKLNGGVRGFIDYRCLNAVTVTRCHSCTIYNTLSNKQISCLQLTYEVGISKCSVQETNPSLLKNAFWGKNEPAIFKKNGTRTLCYCVGVTEIRGLYRILKNHSRNGSSTSSRPLSLKSSTGRFSPLGTPNPIVQYQFTVCTFGRKM